jgi:hypothetical protein
MPDLAYLHSTTRIDLQPKYQRHSISTAASWERLALDNGRPHFEWIHHHRIFCAPILDRRPSYSPVIS